MEEEYISGEEHQDMQSKQPRQAKQPRLVRLPIAVMIAVVVMLIAFAGGWLGGAHHQKSHDSALASAASGSTLNQVSSGGNSPILCTAGQACSGGNSSSGGPTICSGGTCTTGGGTPVVGTVTAVDASSITIQAGGGSSTTATFSITNTTGFSKGAGTGALSTYSNGDVQVGETVGVVPSSSSSTQAQIIIDNPPTSK